MAAIYFSGAITGGRDDVPMYRRIVQALESAGHRVFAGGVAAEHVGSSGEAIDAVSIFERDMGWIRQVAGLGGILVAEVSKPSTGVGYEIAAARYEFGIPVICLFRPAYTPRCTAMVAGDAGIETIEYDDGSVDRMLGRLLRAVEEVAETAAIRE